jgi:hypothetical protein
MPADGAGPQATKRRRDTAARTKIHWAVRQEVNATAGLTSQGFEFLSPREQHRRISGRLEREGVPEVNCRR